MSKNPHDALFKTIFRDPKNLLALLEENLPPALVKQLDMKSAKEVPGNFIDPNQTKRFSDLLFEIRLAGRATFVYVLAEHQSESSPLICLRLLIYMGRIWDSWLRQKEKATKRGEGPLPRRVPAILPLVLFQGPRRWTASREFLDLIDLKPEQLAAVREYLPEFRYAFENLADSANQELRERKLSALGTLGLLLLKHARDRREQFLTALKEAMDLFRALSLDEQTTVVSYTVEVVEFSSSQEVAEVFVDDVSPRLRELIMTFAEKLRAEGRAEGLAEGRAEGQAEGSQRLLLRLLRARFPDQVSANIATRVQAAGEPQLEVWGERVLTASTLDEVFAG